MKPILIIQNWAAESAGTIADYLDEQSLTYRVVRTYKNESIPDTNQIEAAIVLGNPNSVNDYQNQPGMPALFSFMANAVRFGLPILGICYGSQILAKVLGAKINKNKVKEIGNYSAKLTESGESDPLFAGFDREFIVFHWHGDRFDIPHGTWNLCETEKCTNQAFRKGKSVGVQFHMEPHINEIPIWCDEYKIELKEESKAKEKIITDFTSRADEIRKLNYLLIGNFLNLSQK